MKLFARAAMLVALSSVVFGCTRPEQARTVLEQQGYDNIEIGWPRPHSCGEDDNFSATFTAVKDGQEVKGVVCSGVLKGSTIRLFD